MEHIFDGKFPDPRVALKNKRQIGLMYTGMAYFMFLTLFGMVYTSPGGPWEPLGIACFSVPLALAVFMSVFIIKIWNNDGCGTSWALRLTFEEAEEWIEGGRLDRQIREVLARTGTHFEKEVLPYRRDIMTWGPVHKYVSDEGPYVEWHRLTQSAFGGRHDMYVMIIYVANITSDALELGRKMFEEIDHLELLREARWQQKWGTRMFDPRTEPRPPRPEDMTNWW